jgi:hypothetical protein
MMRAALQWWAAPAETPVRPITPGRSRGAPRRISTHDAERLRARGRRAERIPIMSVLPRKLTDLLAFCNARLSLWGEHFSDIGLEQADVDAWSLLITNAQNKATARTAAAASAKSATEAMKEAGSELLRKSAELVRKIKTYAESQSKPGDVYQLANIPMPQSPSSMPPPGQPTTFKAVLEPDGALTIAWKCPNPPGAVGTVYAIRRRISETAPWEFVGAVGVKKFTDHGVPTVSSVSYQVQAQRGAKVGAPSFPFTVLFGSGGGGFFITSQFEGDSGEGGEGVKLAA